jgi:tetratricopeptide (TPR) repeat protein
MNGHKKHTVKMEDILYNINSVIADENASYEERKLLVMSLLKSAKANCPEAEENKELYAKIVYTVADFLSDNDDNDMAANLFLEHLELCDKIYGQDSIQSADSLCNIGYTLIEDGDAETGMALLMKALKIREKTFGFGHLETANNYLIIGGGYQSIGDIPHTVEFFEKGKEALLACGESQKAIDVQRSIGVIYAKNDMKEEALQQYNKTMDMIADALGVVNAEYAAMCNAIGVLLNEENMNIRAFNYFNKAIEISLEVNGYFDEDTGTYYRNAALTLFKMGEFAQFSEYIEKSLEIRDALLNPNHLALAETYMYFAIALLWRKDIPTALQYFQKALDIKKSQLGEDSEEVNELLSYMDAVASKPIEDAQAIDLLLKGWRDEELN